MLLVRRRGLRVFWKVFVRAFHGDPDELEFRRDVTTTQFRLSPKLDSQLQFNITKVEKLADELRVPCFLHEEKDYLPIGARLGLAEELASTEYPSLLPLLNQLKLAVVDQIDKQELFRCLYCRRFLTDLKKNIGQKSRLPCPARTDDLQEDNSCCFLRVELDEVFSTVKNLWAKKLLLSMH